MPQRRDSIGYTNFHSAGYWVILSLFFRVSGSEDVAAEISGALKRHGKVLDGDPDVEYCFAGFYRIMRFNMMPEG